MISSTANGTLGRRTGDLPAVNTKDNFDAHHYPSCNLLSIRPDFLRKRTIVVWTRMRCGNRHFDPYKPPRIFSRRRDIDHRRLLHSQHPILFRLQPYGRGDNAPRRARQEKSIRFPVFLRVLGIPCFMGLWKRTGRIPTLRVGSLAHWATSVEGRRTPLVQRLVPRANASFAFQPEAGMR